MKRVRGKLLTTILLAFTCGCLAGCQVTGNDKRYAGEESGQGKEFTAEGVVSLDAKGSAKITAQEPESNVKSEIMCL